MPKIRGIRPEFWTDEDLMDCSIPAKLLFIGMWNWACDNGHLSDKPKQIRARIMPYEDIDAEALIDELEQFGRITRADGVITIRNFAKHQKPNRRWWVTCDLTECVVPDGHRSRSDSPSDNPPQQEAKVGQQEANFGQQGAKDAQPAFGDGDGDGDGEKKKTSSSSSRAERGTRITEDWIPGEKVRQDLAAAYPHVDLLDQHERFVDYWIGVTGQRGTKTMRGWDGAFRNWIKNAAAKPATTSRQPARGEGNIENEHLAELMGPPTW